MPEDLRSLNCTELAWLEWTLRRVFDGVDAAPVDLSTLGSIDWDHARFRFAPTLCLGEMTTNAAAIWTALTQSQTPPPVALLPAPATILIWRHDLTPSFRTLENVELRLLRQALLHWPFGELCKTLGAEIGDEAATATAGAVLGQWLHDGLIVGVD